MLAGSRPADVVGAFALGALTGAIARHATTHSARAVRVFLGAGVLGGFTTFSAFSLETALLIERRELALAAGYVVASVMLSIGALFVGLFIARRVFA